MMHVRVGFAEPLVGPLLAGSLRYLGLGLFVPDRDERAASASRPERAPA
jgi:CRISPR-associated protein Csb2